MRFVLRALIYVVFAFALLFVGVVWYTFAQSPTLQNANMSRTVTNTNTGGNMNGEMSHDASAQTHHTINGNYNAAHDGAMDESELEPPTIGWRELNTSWGYGNAEAVTLRSGPDSSASVVAILYLAEYDGAEILESTRDHLRVRFPANTEAGGTRERDYEGWVEWGEVVPYASAVVVEAESGAVVARLPLDAGLASVAYSPDGKRAVFYGTSAHDMHGEGGVPTAVEINAESFKAVRVLETSAAGGFASIFYDPAGGELHALTRALRYHEKGTDSKLYPFRIKGDKIEAAAVAFPAPALGHLVVSPDGRTGLVMHNTGEATQSTRFDVIDMLTYEARHSFEIAGGGAEGWAYEHALSRDGSEFYFRDASSGKIAVVNTRTGARIREMPLRLTEERWVSFWQESLIGDSLLLRSWQDVENGESKSQSFWLRPDGEMVETERGVDLAIEVKGVRYAINDSGTRLFKLDAEGRVRERLKIERPESKFNKTVKEELTITGLSATPDGKYLILFIGMLDGC